MRIKCKLCKRFIEGMCLKFERKRSSGKKRFCGYFIEKKIIRKPIPITVVSCMTKADRKKELLKKRIEAEKLFEKVQILEQEKQKSVIVEKKPKIKEQKKGFFKRIFSKIRDK